VASRGGGTANIRSKRFTVEQGDMFVFPSWNPFLSSADEPTDRFRITDAPVLELLGLFRQAEVNPEVAR
jgi:gentisate 1,2-dioxygenase